MARDFGQQPIIPYKIHNHDDGFTLYEGRRNKGIRLCDKAFERFERLRGSILSSAIAVEIDLDWTIATYFLHFDNAKSYEKRHADFTDLVLGQEGFTFRSKLETVVGIIALAEIVDPTKKDFRNALERIMKVRNKFAHRQVHIDWQTRSISFWNAMKQCREDPLDENLGENYKRKCRDALTVISKVRTAVYDLRHSDDMPDA